MLKRVFFYIFCFFLATGPAFSQGEFHPAHQAQGTEKVNLADVVDLQIQQTDFKTNKINLILKTKNGFKIYEGNLKFSYVPSKSLPYELKYSASPLAQEYFDPFYKEKKKVFKDGTFFALDAQTQLNENDKIQITLQACSQSMCLLPGTLLLSVREGAVSSLSQETIAPSFSEATPTPVSAPAVLAPAPNINSFNYNIAEQVEAALLSKSFLLFPALFLAGLLMNLTPCVYPMIPITLSVMSYYGAESSISEEEKRRRRRVFPFVYVGGMVVTYSLLGVIAAMTGSLFGSQFASPVFSIAMAGVMFLLGFAMLGGINFSFVQNFANKIPLARGNPVIAVATMGAVSGLVSAPCTGPVLSMVLLLIAQNKDPVSGFVFMLFLACGFGFPYVILGFFSQNLASLPKFPKLVFCTKVFFATTMFSLGIYFLHGILQKVSFLSFLFSKPSYFIVGANVVLMILFVSFYVKDILGRIFKKVFYLGTVFTSFALALWLTLWVSNSFLQNNNAALDLAQENLKNSPIHWKTDLDAAVSLAKKEHKPLLVDIWAQWCAACLEMDQTTWQNLEIADILNKKYVSVRIDYTHASKETEKLLDRWQIVGLPGVVIIQPGDDFNMVKPQKNFQGKISDTDLLNSLQ